MTSKPLSRLLFAQGGKCFFCERQLSPTEASVEHLVASANGGNNGDDNCVACCKTLNALLGRMSLKEKIRVVLNQKGHFKCPNESTAENAPAPAATGVAVQKAKRLDAVVEDLRRRGAARPGSAKTLKSTISAYFQKTLSVEEVDALVESLNSSGVVVLNGTKVTYKF